MDRQGKWRSFFLTHRTAQGKSEDGKTGEESKPSGMKEDNRCLGAGSRGMPEVVEVRSPSRVSRSLTREAGQGSPL